MYFRKPNQIWSLFPLNNLKRYNEVIFTSLLDFLILLAGWFFYNSIQAEGLTVVLQKVQIPVLASGILLSIFWILVFVLAGLYKKLYLMSRLDEFLSVLKATVTGVLILFFVFVMMDVVESYDEKMALVKYWALIVVAMSLNRFVIRSVQKYYAQQGKGLHNTVIIGTGKNARIAKEDLVRNKTLGMHVLGFIQVNGKVKEEDGVEEKDIIGHLDGIEDIIEKYKVQDVLVALEQDRRTDLVNIISKVDVPDITLKLLPDFYQLVSGFNKTNQIFGLPIVEISPEPMPLWERATKRLIDIAVSIVALILSIPLCIIVAILIKVGTEGPVIYSQVRVGRNGKKFTIYKFRTMYLDAESETGPTWASVNDPRITKVGYWLRKLRIDEVPQFVNVLKGDMSLVGPRPERPHFVEQFTREIPLYTRRLRVRPGITGWAQVKWKYGSSLDTVKEKTKYDLYYIENISLKMDTKILIITILTIIKGKGQ